MSGIAGIIHFDGQPVAPGQIETMTTAIAYRGPDGINHWRKGHVALGQCMLRTTPESQEETLPLTNEDESLMLVMDGRVDNWEELRSELLSKGATLRTRADAELVLRAYEIWGRDCLPHIEGDFALVIWDARRHEAFCAKDRVGSRRFNYYWNGRTLVFATDVQAILALPFVPEVFNDGMLVTHLAGEWHSPPDETWWSGILRLAPAHTMVAGVNGLQIRRYWLPDLHATLPCHSDGEYIEHYRALFTDVVRRMSRSSHPLACGVSGGLDSSAIFAIAEYLRRDGSLLAPGLEGYTLDFRGDAAADELDYSRAVGAHLHRTIHEVAPACLPLDWHRDYARRYRELPELPHYSMTLSIAEAVRAHGCRVWLNGLGGDEWAGGSHAYYAEMLAGWQGRALLDIFRSDCAEIGVQNALWRLLRFGAVPLLPESVRRHLRAIFGSSNAPAANAKLSWLTPKFIERLAVRRRHHTPEVPAAGRRGSKNWISFLTGPRLIKQEMNELQSAYMGLEWRRPFWDARIIQFAIATPEYLRRRGNENKWMHRQAMTGLLPEVVLHRTSKAEFSVIYAPYRVKLCKSIIEDILPRRQDWVNAAGIQAMIQRVLAQEGEALEAENVLWALFTADALAGAGATTPRKSDRRLSSQGGACYGQDTEVDSASVCHPERM